MNPLTISFAPRTANYIEFRSNPATSPNTFWDLPRLGAYLTTGQTLAIDGTYNVFFQENGALPASTTGDGNPGLAAIWTDHISDNGNPGSSNPGNPGSMIWHFNQGYKFYGAYLTHLSDSFNLVNAQVDVSYNGTSWTSVYTPTSFSTGYMLFNPNPGYASWVRLSWDPSGTGGGREITEFQLFGMTPEPTSLALLGLGAVALLRRKRS